MKHQVIAPPQFVLSGPPVILETLLLAHMPLLLELCPSLRLVLDEHINDARARGPFIQLNLRKPTNPALTSQRVGKLTYSAFAPCGTPEPTGWVGNSTTVLQSVGNRFGQDVFGQDPALMVGSMASKILAMKTIGLGAILPDIAGNMDKDLVRLDEYTQGVSAPVWLSYKSGIFAHIHSENLLEWIKACILESNWLNAATAVPYVETPLSAPPAMGYMAEHDK